MKFPFLPTINVGSNSKPILIPVELVTVIGGQSRASKVTGDMTAQMIKYAAVRPDERQKFITSPTDGISSILNSDPTASAFGLNKISLEPLKCNASLLPPAKIRYGGQNGEVEPGLSGGWNTKGISTYYIFFLCIN